MLQLLTTSSLTINSLAGNFEMSRPAVSKHVKILEGAGFITIRDVGRERHCFLKQEGFHLLQDWINFFDNFWMTRLSNLETILTQKSTK